MEQIAGSGCISVSNCEQCHLPEYDGSIFTLNGIDLCSDCRKNPIPKDVGYDDTSAWWTSDTKDVTCSLCGLIDPHPENLMVANWGTNWRFNQPTPFCWDCIISLIMRAEMEKNLRKEKENREKK